MQGITHCIDWLQFSNVITDRDSPAGIVSRVMPNHEIAKLTGEKGTNIKGYDTCLLMGAGRVHFHTLHPENKLSVQFTGQDLSAAASEGLTAEAIMSTALQNGAFMTRIDFAVDIKGKEANQNDVLVAINTGTAETLAQSWGAYVGYKKIDGKVYQDGTVYIGSPASPRMVRVYNKGAERGTRELWTRIELVSRKDAAHALSVAMVPNGTGPTGRSALRSYIRSGVAWFDEALQGETVYIQPVEKPIRDTVRWLHEDVLPILARVLAAETLTDKSELYDAVSSVLYRTKQLRDRGYTGEGGTVDK